MTEPYYVQKMDEPEGTAEVRLRRAMLRIQEIDKEAAHLREERGVVVQEMNRAMGELQSSIEKAQHVLRENEEVKTAGPIG